MAAALPPSDFRTEAVEIAGPGSRCAVRWRQWDRDDPEPIFVDCGRRRVLLDREWHGFAATKLSPCHVLVLTSAINRPALHSVDNCAGRLHTINLSARWEGELIRKVRITPSRVARVIYESRKGKPGCYHLNFVYEHRPKTPTFTALDSIEADYCAPSLP